jgi:hypothetical protein
MHCQSQLRMYIIHVQEFGYDMFQLEQDMLR